MPEITTEKLPTPAGVLRARAKELRERIENHEKLAADCERALAALRQEIAGFHASADELDTTADMLDPRPVAGAAA